MLSNRVRQLMSAALLAAAWVGAGSWPTPFGSGPEPAGFCC